MPRELRELIWKETPQMYQWNTTAYASSARAQNHEEKLSSARDQNPVAERHSSDMIKWKPEKMAKTTIPTLSLTLITLFLEATSQRKESSMVAFDTMPRVEPWKLRLLNGVIGGITTREEDQGSASQLPFTMVSGGSHGYHGHDRKVTVGTCRRGSSSG
ncbi:hypothetical protein HN51_051890 [Arachis hypogaea]